MSGGMKIRRQIIDVGTRRVHLRIAGEGPPVVLFHESPRSSVAVLPLLAALAPHFTVYAPDTPGYGLSDPLALERPEIADYADAMAGMLDVLGLERTAIYGTHTGAEIAMELTLRHPGKIAMTVLDGYPVFSVAEREETLRHYLPAFPPEWSGAHMAALWSRVRDQFMFFPWYSVGEARRLGWDPRPLEFHDQVIADLMAAGNGYATAYAAAFRYDAGSAVARAGAAGLPLVYTTRADDLLFGHLDVIEAIDPKAEILRLGPDRSIWADTMVKLLARADLPPAPALPAQSQRAWFDDGDLLMRRFGPADGPARLLLHGHPGSGRLLESAARAAATAGPVYVPDLPGSGYSAPVEPGEGLAGRMAARVAKALPEGRFRVDAWFTGGLVADALHRMSPGTFDVTDLHDPLPTGEQLERLKTHYVQELSSDWHGSHIVGAWHRARDGMLYAPWFDRRTANHRPLEVTPDIDLLQAHAEAILQGRTTEPGIIRSLFEQG